MRAGVSISDLVLFIIFLTLLLRENTFVSDLVRPNSPYYIYFFLVQTQQMPFLTAQKVGRVRKGFST